MCAQAQGKLLQVATSMTSKFKPSSTPLQLDHDRSIHTLAQCLDLSEACLDLLVSLQNFDLPAVCSVNHLLNYGRFTITVLQSALCLRSITAGGFKAKVMKGFASWKFTELTWIV
jgi:hypothetical protein